MDMSIWFWQKPLEILPTWILHLLNMGVENIVMSDSEWNGLASLMIHSSLPQQLPSAHHTLGNQVILDRLIEAIREVWPIQVIYPYLPNRWKTYAELQQVLQELGMKNTIYNMNHQISSEFVHRMDEKSGTP